MTAYYLNLGWFSGMDLVLEFALAIMALIVMFYAFKAYRFTQNKDVKSLGIGFLLLAGSYISLSVMNVSTLASAREGLLIPSADLVKLIHLDIISSYIYILLYLSGLVFFSKCIIKDKNLTPFLLLYLPSIIAIVVSDEKLLLFHTLSLVFLALLAVHYGVRYSQKKQTNQLLIFLAFLFLFIGHVQFAFATQNAVFFVLGHLFGLIAYALILVAVFRIKK